jgi:hypothetical protein
MATKPLVLFGAVVGGLFTVCNISFAQSWSETGAPLADWTGVASSADGTKLVAVCYAGALDLVGIYTSTNSGGTWQPTSAPNDPDTNQWSAVASSADGVKLVAVSQGSSGAIYTSTNSGHTWQPTTAPVDDYSCVASSPDGTKLAAASGYGYSVYISTNSGGTWMDASVGFLAAHPWHAVSISADGTKVVAASGDNSDQYGGGLLAYSTNSGVSWHAGNAPFDQLWWALACSTNGDFVVATSQANTNDDPGPIYTSSDAGANWTITLAPMESWLCVCCSADGTKLSAGFYDYYTGSEAGVYSSTDSGTSWTQDKIIPTAFSITCSADGSKRVATTGNLWVSSSQSASPSGLELVVGVSGKNLVFTWPTNQAGFKLQQKATLGSITWATLTNAPAIINGQYRLLLLPTNSPTFYRLGGTNL